ncbi:MAG: response regulator [Elusimicrobiales bacterium]|nr:response regulator [Elusimicrobiales bacterium]
MTKILIIDDEPQHIELVKLRLKKQGFEVDSSLTAAGGAAAAEKQAPDLILLDLLLPDMKPEEAIAALRSVPGAARIPIIAFTALDSFEIHRRKLGQELAGLVPKPYEAQKLQAEIRKVLGKQSVPKQRLL